MAEKREYEKLLERERNMLEKLKKCQRKCNQGNEMTLLHKYNEIKDATQILLGSIANIECVTIKELHERYELPLKD